MGGCRNSFTFSSARYSLFFLFERDARACKGGKIFTPYDPSFYGIFWGHIFLPIWGVGVVKIVFTEPTGRIFPLIWSVLEIANLRNKDHLEAANRPDIKD